MNGNDKNEEEEEEVEEVLLLNDFFSCKWSVIQQP